MLTFAKMAELRMKLCCYIGKLNVVVT